MSIFEKKRSVVKGLTYQGFSHAGTPEVNFFGFRLNYNCNFSLNLCMCHNFKQNKYNVIKFMKKI